MIALVPRGLCDGIVFLEGRSSAVKMHAGTVSDDMWSFVDLSRIGLGMWTGKLSRFRFELTVCLRMLSLV